MQIGGICKQIDRHFCTILRLSEPELAGYVILDKALGHPLAVVGGTLDADRLAEVFADGEYRASLFLLIADGGETAGTHECAFLREVVAEVGQDPALLVLHVARNPVSIHAPAWGATPDLRTISFLGS